MKHAGLRLIGAVAFVGCQGKASDTGATTRTAVPSFGVGIARIDTHDVVIDEQVFDREWTDVDLELVEVREGETATFDATATWTGFAAMHVRGNSSIDYEKKQYTVETRDAAGEDVDSEFFGLPEEEDWVLHAPYSDKTLMRNHLMYQWSRAIGRYAPRTQFVELYMEDGGDTLGEEDYRGVYVLMEKIKRDSNRVDIASMEPTDNSAPEVEGGYLLRRDWVESDAIVTDLYEDELLFEYPSVDDVTDDQWDYIAGFLDRFEEALDKADGTHANFADMESFADHMLLMEMSRNVDAYVLSTYMHKDRDGLLTMGPIWDFNGALGNADYFESWETEGWHYENSEFPADNPNGFAWYERLLEDDDFQALLSERWTLHRADVWSDDALTKDIDETADYLAAAQERNFERWPVLGEVVWPNDTDAEERDTYEAEIEHLKTWLTDRTAWLDSQWLQ
mgnify:CR=1 FL=1